MDELLTIGATADRMNIPERRVLALIERGALRRVTVAGEPRVPAAEIRRYQDGYAERMLARMDAVDDKRWRQAIKARNARYGNPFHVRAVRIVIIFIAFVIFALWQGSQHLPAHHVHFPTPTPMPHHVI